MPSGSATLPRALEAFADQPWLRTTAVGFYPEPAQRFRSTRFVSQQRGLGAPLEKYREDSTRVNETEAPDAAARHIAHAAPSPAAYRGIPPCVCPPRRGVAPVLPRPRALTAFTPIPR